MELVETSPPGEAIRNGSTEFNLSAGNKLQIRQNETGDIVYELDETVPAGKKWVVIISVRVAETDV